MTRANEFGNRQDLARASIADLAALFETTQLLETILLGQANSPRLTQTGESLLDSLFINPVSDRQEAIIAEIEGRAPEIIEEQRLQAVALARWHLLDRDFDALKEAMASISSKGDRAIGEQTGF